MELPFNAYNSTFIAKVLRAKPFISLTAFSGALQIIYFPLYFTGFEGGQRFNLFGERQQDEFINLRLLENECKSSRFNYESLFPATAIIFLMRNKS